MFIDLQDINDDNIRSMKDALLLRNVLLTFKHARNNEFFRSNFKEILIFVDESVSEEILMHLFIITLLYFPKVSTFKETEIMELVQTLPLEHEQKAKSTFDQIKDRHIKEGMEKGMEKMLRSFIQKYPDWTDVQIASFFDIKIEFVKQVRSAMNAS